MNVIAALRSENVPSARRVLIATAAHLTVCAALWVAGVAQARFAFLDGYMATAGAAFVVAMAFIEFSLAQRILTNFTPGEPLVHPWRLIAAAALVRMAGAAVLGAERWIDALRGPSSAIFAPLRHALLAAALFLVVRLYRRLGVVHSPGVAGYIAVALVVAYASFAASVVVGLGGTQEWRLDPRLISALLSDQFLAVVLLLALLLRAAAERMGGGLVSYCWSSYGAAVVLSAFADLSVLLSNSDLVPEAIANLNWLLGYAAAAAYALGPAFQYDAIQYAFSRPSAVSGRLHLK